MKIVRKKKDLPPAMIGTAGHVDHGKTSLVKILTGCDTDKLKEEKERGLSINLGFAPCALSGERMVGIVDVPGHIDFIRNMVSGASSIDILILVVAADDGIMPQTVEHLQIIKMLSSPKLMVALTKIDLVDEEMVELAKEEITDFLSEMGFPDVPVMPVSNIKLDGVSAVKNKIEEMVDDLDGKHDQRLFRMNIQKHFSVKGMGTVATGIPISGELNIDDPLVLLPDMKDTTVRALQNYKLDTDHTASKICCAVNIRDINEEELERGMSLIAPGAYKSEESAIVTVQNISKKYTIKHNNTLRFHCGTFESKVKISIIGSNSIKPMCNGYAKLLFDKPIVLAAGDRFVIRETTPSMTVGGGRVLLPGSFRFKRSSEEFAQRLTKAEEYLDNEDFLSAQLIISEKPYFSKDEIIAFSCLGMGKTDDLIQAKLKDGFLSDLTGDCFLVTKRLPELFVKVSKILKKYHSSHKYSWGIDSSALANMLDLKKKSAAVLIKEIVKNSPEFQFTHGRLSLKSFSPAITEKQIKQKDAILDIIREAGFEATAKGTVVNELNIAEKEFRLLSNILIEEDEIVVMGKYYISKECFEQCELKLRELATEKGVIELKDYRDLINTGRNITVIILEKFDSLGITKRFPEGRKLI